MNNTGDALNKLKSDPAVVTAQSAAKAAAERAALLHRQRSDREAVRGRLTADVRRLRGELTDIEMGAMIGGTRDAHRVARIRDELARAEAVLDGGGDDREIAQRYSELSNVAQQAQHEAHRISRARAQELRRPVLEKWRRTLIDLANEIDSYCNVETAFDRDLCAAVPPIHAAIGTAIEAAGYALGDRTAKASRLVNKREQAAIAKAMAEINARQQRQREDDHARRAQAMRQAGILRTKP